MSEQNPILPRRRLALELRRLRDEAGLTLEDVATDLLISTSKLSRLENGQGSPQARDVRDLIRHYGVENTQLATRLMRWVSSSRRQGWWADYADSMQRGLDGYVAYESEAAVARVYTIPVLPVLLQTGDYALAQYQSMEPWRSPDELDQLVRLRLRRQDALTAREGMAPLRLIAITHECALRQWVGSAQTMRAALDHLVERSTEPNIELRVLPFTAPPLFTSTCMYAYFEFSDALDRDVVNIETHAGFRHIETPEIVHQYRRHYDDLRNAALSPENSRALIREIQSGQFS
ncbi:helix-turn-helix transcriptional regulator [Actinophytocola sp.]|uniref:helix-turn-helix domain-containing protein n=1 Tax=Actinophytocola sp. TaxID=1872138 RepID=UPI002D80EAEE|nr:helix-turn-helix transcriptional regulator [Actinophytocola sp.]HET9138872.1 helix-turn-helix transcriptional regulator [Actinophytocola sp.]